MAKFFKQRSKPAQTVAQPDEMELLLSQFMANEPRNGPTIGQASSPAPSNGGISLAELLPDLFEPLPASVPVQSANSVLAPPAPVQPVQAKRKGLGQLIGQVRGNNSKVQQDREEARLNKLQQISQNVREQQAQVPPALLPSQPDKAQEKAEKQKAKELERQQQVQAQLSRQREKEQQRLMRPTSEQQALIKQRRQEEKLQANQRKLEAKEQSREQKLDHKHQERLAQLGLLAQPGQELTPEQQAKAEALRHVPDATNSKTPILIAVGLALLLMAAGVIMAFFIIPADVELGELKAPGKSVRYDFNASVLDTVKKAIATAKGLDEKKLKRLEVEMVAATNPQTPGQIIDYFNAAIKEKDKDFVPNQPLDPVLVPTLSLRGIGIGTRPVVWIKKGSAGSLDDLYLAVAVPLVNSPGATAALNSLVQTPNGPVSATGSLIVLARAKIPQ